MVVLVHLFYCNDDFFALFAVPFFVGLVAEMANEVLRADSQTFREA